MVQRRHGGGDSNSDYIYTPARVATIRQEDSLVLRRDFPVGSFCIFDNPMAPLPVAVDLWL